MTSSNGAFPNCTVVGCHFFFVDFFFLQIRIQKIFFERVVYLLLLGVAGAWLGIYTGDLADGIVARKLCDPTVLKDHELAAQTMTYLFTGAAVIHVLFYLGLLRSRLHVFAPYVIFACMLIGSVFLIRAGHLGALIVYQQGGGVYKHTVDCDEYK